MTHQQITSSQFQIFKNGLFKSKQLRLEYNLLYYSEKKYFHLQDSYVELIKHPLITNPGITITNSLKQLSIFGDIYPLIDRIKYFVIQTNFEDNYRLLSPIGQGLQSQVYSIKSKFSGKEFACKIIQKTESPLPIKKEIHILRSLNHENIVKIHELYETKDHLFLVLELLQGNELFVRKYSEQNTRIMIKSLLSAINLMHSKGIFHRDIKPSNIVFKDHKKLESICLIDFGLADYWTESGDYQYTKCGTPGFVAPEILHDKKYTLSVDIYSLGLIMYMLLTGKLPFDGLTYDDIVISNYRAQIDFNLPFISNDCLDLLKQLLNRDYKQRIPAKLALEHPFFTLQNKQRRSSKSQQILSISSLPTLPPIEQTKNRKIIIKKRIVRDKFLSNGK